MSEDNTITIDEVSYDFNELSDQAKLLLQHVADLDNKIRATKFNLDQLQVGRDKFFELLKAEITQK